MIKSKTAEDKMAEEQIIIVNQHNRKIGVVPRSEMRKNNLRHRTTFILVFNSKGEILITKRTKTKDVYLGLYEVFHGGTVAAGETPKQNACKEIREEIGARHVRLKFLFRFRYQDKVQNCIGYVYQCRYDGKIKPQKEEVESYFFAPLEKVKKMIKEEPKKFAADGLFAFQKYRKIIGN